ncbi:ankyrin repeat domain-containing protein [Lysinibacillus sp. UBA5990]|uniref:ankyrin repeat domain-containing protein n=1 Tax=Lysinibacillus sp. UBA5990 TaxID=1946773 RepID=UPI0025BCAEB6|nr:ankyrin repeat domain-containing protein [Lysinibacillus sp. UBA5990]
MEDTIIISEFLAAAEAGDRDTLQRFLQQGIDINARNKQKQTAILLAAMNDQLETVKFLIQEGADINLQDQICLNPFLYGCINGKLELVKIMLQANTDLERLTRFGGVGVHPASEKGFVEVVRELVTKTDINVNHTNICGWTPLIEAILLNDGGEKQQEIVRLLVGHGADTQLVDQYGVTPLAIAREKGFTAIEKILLEAGAK